jgi:hypothetical protein
MDRAIPPWHASRLDAAVNATNKPMPATVSEIGKKASLSGCRKPTRSKYSTVPMMMGST